MPPLSAVSHHDLIQGCIRNDRRAQEALYKNFYETLAIICMRYTKNQQDAKEVLQNSFLKAFQQIGTFDESKASLYTWLRTITVRCAIDFLRRQKKTITTQELSEDHGEAVDAEALQRMTSQQVLQLVQKLPATTQAVFNLYIMEGYNHREIGELLQISEGTSKWHLSEARKLLTNLLEQARA